MIKVASLAITTSYQSLGAILSAQTDEPFGPIRTLKSGWFKNAGSNPVRVSLGNTHASEGDDDVSVLLETGDPLSFDVVNLNEVFAKTTTGSSTLEVCGEGD